MPDPPNKPRSLAQCPPGISDGLPAPQRWALSIALQQVEPDGRVVDPLAVPLAIRSLLTDLGRAEPVTVILDDAQWLDPATAGGLAFALRRLAVPPQRLSVLAGVRPEGLRSDLVRTLPEPRHDVDLSPLDEPAIAQLLRRHFGSTWTRAVSAVPTAASGFSLWHNGKFTTLATPGGWTVSSVVELTDNGLLGANVRNAAGSEWPAVWKLGT